MFQFLRGLKNYHFHQFYLNLFAFHKTLKFRYPINVPHPEPIAVPQYIRVPIPQPYPKYTHVKHRIEIPVYKIIPEIIEKPVPYTVEKPYPGKVFNV